MRVSGCGLRVNPATRNSQHATIQKNVQLFFSHPGKSSYLVVNGEAAIILDKEKIEENARILKKTLESFEIEGEVTAARQGPVITLYEFRPAPGVKVSKIAGLQDDITMALSAKSVRILAPLPGKNVVGFEIIRSETVEERTNE